MLAPITLKILNERLKDLKHIQTRYQSTEVLSDILETEAAINELTSVKHETCEGCIYETKRHEHWCDYCSRVNNDHFKPKD